MKYVYIFIVLMFGEYVFAQSGVIAHRGFWKTDGSAQNSIAALLKADSVGCYGQQSYSSQRVMISQELSL